MCFVHIQIPGSTAPITKCSIYFAVFDAIKLITNLTQHKGSFLHTSTICACCLQHIAIISLKNHSKVIQEIKNIREYKYLFLKNTKMDKATEIKSWKIGVFHNENNISALIYSHVPLPFSLPPNPTPLFFLYVTVRYCYAVLNKP